MPGIEQHTTRVGKPRAYWLSKSFADVCVIAETVETKSNLTLLYNREERTLVNTMAQQRLNILSQLLATTTSKVLFQPFLW